VEINWYDGGIKPMMPDGWPLGRNMNVGGGAAVFYGTKDTLICGSAGRSPWLLSGRTPANVPTTQRDIPTVPGRNDDTDTHVMDWVRACQESPESRIQPVCNFTDAGPFNEMVVMGVVAVRLQGLNRQLEWDGPNMQFTNIGDNDQIRMILEDRFSVVDGHPDISPLRTDPFNAKAFAQELIKHTYRDGWSLPAMPV
jgi:hypothetical protein